MANSKSTAAPAAAPQSSSTAFTGPMAEPTNPLIGTCPNATIHNAKCALTYLREWAPSEDGATTGRDIEYGRWLLLGVVEQALEHALQSAEVLHG